MTTNTRRIVAIALFVLTLLAFAVSIFFTPIWELYVHYVLFELLGPLGVGKWPAPAGMSAAFVATFVPLISLGALIGTLFRPLIRVAPFADYEDLSRRLIEAQRALKDSTSFLEGLSKDVAGKFSELEALSRDLEAMKAVHEENAVALRAKVEFINRKPRWLTVLTHVTAFVVGIFGNIIASYIYDYMK